MHLIKYTSLSEVQIFYIIKCFGIEKTPEKVKENFDKFFAPDSVDGKLLLEVAMKYKNEINGVREKHSQYPGIDIADPVKQMEMLQEIYEYCMTDRIIGVAQDGTPIEKKEAHTAKLAVELAWKIRVEEKLRKQKGQEKSDDDDEEPPQITVIHTR